MYSNQLASYQITVSYTASKYLADKTQQEALFISMPEFLLLYKVSKGCKYL